MMPTGIESDRLPPHSIEAEQGVLGCILLSPDECLDDCMMKIVPECFYDMRHRIIYEQMVAMAASGKPIDTISLQQELRDNKQMDSAGGLVYMSSLPDCVPSAANLDYYLETVRDKWALRRMIGTCTNAVATAYNNNEKTNNLISRLESDIVAISNHETTSSEFNSTQCVDGFISDLDSRILRQGAPSGIVTGFTDLDNLCDGLQHGEQFIVGARPSIGKTALGLNLFLKACIIDKIPSVFVSLEQCKEALMRRLTSACCRIPMQHLRKGTLSESQIESIQQFNIDYRNSPATIYDFVNSGASATIIASLVRRCARKGAKLFIIDYLQKVRPPSRHEKRTYEVAEISGILRSAAVGSRVAMVTLCQLNREPEKDKGRSPRLVDLADSGQIERDADMVGLLHRDRDQSSGPAQLYIAKQRDGEVGIVRLYFQGQYCLFTNGTNEQQ